MGADAVTDADQGAGQTGHVLTIEWGKQHPADHLDVTWQDASKKRAASGRNGHGGAALVVERRRARDEPGLVELRRLVGESATAVDDAIGDVGHALLTAWCVVEAGEDLELDVAQVTLGAQLLFDGVVEEAADLHQREVGGELLGVEVRAVGHAGSVLATKSKQC